MKNNIFMIFILLVLIIANILVYCYGVNIIFVLVVTGIFIYFFRGIKAEKYSDVFNIHTFKFTLTKDNLLELAGAFILSILICKNTSDESGINIGQILLFIITWVSLYRSTFFDLSKKISNVKN